MGELTREEERKGGKRDSLVDWPVGVGDAMMVPAEGVVVLVEEEGRGGERRTCTAPLTSREVNDG